MTTSVSPAYTLELRQRLTAMVNRYDIVATDGGVDRVLAFAQQKRMALKEHVSFFADDSRGEPVMTMQARNVLELAGTYDVLAAGGEQLGVIRKDVRASLLRSTYVLELASGPTLTGAERGAVRSLLRRAVGLVDLPWPLPIQFDFTDPGGQLVMSIDRKVARLRDLYYIRVYRPELDWRVAAAQAVAVDAFMNR